MDLKEANLTIKKIWITASYLTTVSKNDKSKVAFLPLETTFEILYPNKESGKAFHIFMEISTTNKEEYSEVSGYRFSVLCEAQFSFTGRLTKHQKDEYIYNSALSMVINNIRGYLLNITSYGMYGQYLMPAVDLTDLINEKMKELQNRQ